jgi:hypothetical protein
MRTLILAGAAVAAAPAAAQSDSITLFELPAYLGRSVTISAETPDLATQSFASKARSAQVTGSWTACTAAKFGGTCRPLTGSIPTLAINGLDRKIVSLRPTNAATNTTSAAAPAAGAAAAATTAAAVKLDDLDADPGTEGQDVAFFARPSLSKSEVSAGSNDRTAGDAFCKAAGFTGSVYTSRARVQASGLIDLATSTKVRGFALRDVLCRR